MSEIVRLGNLLPRRDFASEFQVAVPSLRRTGKSASPRVIVDLVHEVTDELGFLRAKCNTRPLQSASPRWPRGSIRAKVALARNESLVVARAAVIGPSRSRGHVGSSASQSVSPTRPSRVTWRFYEAGVTFPSRASRVRAACA